MGRAESLIYTVTREYDVDPGNSGQLCYFCEVRDLHERDISFLVGLWLRLK
jgi:hypothetical protein